MASIYFRVPHYVASYIRNRDPKNRIAAGEVLHRDNSERLEFIISNGLFFNPEEKLMKNGCFCERQWNKMLRGHSIFNNTGKSKPLIPPKNDSKLLSDDEVKLLSGIDYGTGGGDGEYLRIAIPEEILLEDGYHRTNKNYQLTNSAASALRTFLLNEFKRGLFDFMDRERLYLQREEVSRTILESLERFMTCYDIQNGERNIERDALKRNFYRWRAEKELRPEDYINHGEI